MVWSAELHRFTLAAIAVDGGDGIVGLPCLGYVRVDWKCGLGEPYLIYIISVFGVYGVVAATVKNVGYLCRVEGEWLSVDIEQLWRQGFGAVKIALQEVVDSFGIVGYKLGAEEDLSAQMVLPAIVDLAFYL